MSDSMSRDAVNRRFGARGVYYRWLAQQHGYLPMLELQEDNQEPISLRKIFISLRLDKKDRDESEVTSNKGDPSRSFKLETTDNLLGKDAFEEVLTNDFMVVSGRPGAGKTTLIKALINELCAGYPSDFRSKAHDKHGAIFTIPIILRELPSLDEIVCFDSLIEQWWELQLKLNEKAFEKDPDTNKRQFSELLNIELLKDSLTHDKLTSLVLFDGIDEVGSISTRKKVYQLARLAHGRGCRVIITGRPSGLDDLKQTLGDDEKSQLELFSTDKELDCESKKPLSLRLLKEKWVYIQPLTKPQIESFIDKWYKLDPTWVSKLGTHPKEFLDALGDPERSHLLPLARRPIFLSLMAIVHCTKNEMPHGRAELYKTIVDVYLTRQRKHRRLKETTKGRPMPQWDSHEPRTALGYIAWRSMHKGGEGRNDDRRILWDKEDLRQELVQAFSKLRFNEIKTEDAGYLIDYFLDPAGLLVEPIDGQIQFSHLSFQEYLCAEYLQGQLTGRRIEKKWRSEVLENLTQSGWDEVALLLMTVHADRTQSRGHFELMSFLDISKKEQADLLFRGMLGKELPIQNVDREQWLCVLIMAAIIHNGSMRIIELHNWKHLRQEGERIISDMIRLETPEGRWSYLENRLIDNVDFLDEYFDTEEHLRDHYSDARLRFITEKSGYDDNSYPLLVVAILAKWGVDKNHQLIDGQNLDKSLLDLIGKYEGKKHLWKMIDGRLSTNGVLECLELLAKPMSKLECFIWNNTPVSAWVLFGQSSPFSSSIGLKGLPSIHSLINTNNNSIPKRSRLSMMLYEVQLFLDMANRDSESLEKKRIREAAKENSSSFSRNILISVLVNQKIRELATQSEFRSVLYSTKQKQENSYDVLVKLFRYPNYQKIGRFYENNDDQNLIFKALRDLIRNRELSVRATSLQLKSQELQKMLRLLLAITSYAESSFAWSWFIDREKHSVRKYLNSDPLPAFLGIFESNGQPCKIQKRNNIAKLKEWLKDDENILRFVFPEGLDRADRDLLINDLQDLRCLEWSPFSFIDITLKNWPDSEPEQDWSAVGRNMKLIDASKEVISILEVDA